MKKIFISIGFYIFITIGVMTWQVFKLNQANKNIMTLAQSNNQITQSIQFVWSNLNETQKKLREGDKKLKDLKTISEKFDDLRKQAQLKSMVK